MIDTTVKNIYRVVDVRVNVPFSHKQVLSCKALKFLADLHLNFNNRRLELLSIRNEKQNGTNTINNFLNSVDELKKLYGNEIEIIKSDTSYILKHSTVPNSNLFLINFESSESTVWSQIIETHINLKEAIENTLSVVNADLEQDADVVEKEIEVMLFPRNLYNEEPNIYIDKLPISAALFDIGIFLFHNAKCLVESGSFPSVFLNNIQNYFEAKYWSEIFSFAEEYLSLPSGSIKAFINFDERLPEFEKRHIINEFRVYVIAA